MSVQLDIDIQEEAAWSSSWLERAENAGENAEVRSPSMATVPKFPNDPLTSQ